MMVLCHRYLGFVNPLEMVHIRDNADMVISLPPLTNCEHSKVRGDLFGQCNGNTAALSCVPDSAHYPGPPP